MSIHFLGLIFIISFMGSFHCAGMCCPFVYAALHRSPTPHSNHGVLWAYHGGRLLTYLILGTSFGIFGALLNQQAMRWGITYAAAWLSGSIVIFNGLSSIGGLQRVVKLPAIFLKFPSMTRTLWQLLDQHHPHSRAAMIGMITTWIPCGWLYAFVAIAMGTGSVVQGMTVMGVFWLGTLPILTTAGLGIDHLRHQLSPRLKLIAALSLVLLGIGSIGYRTDPFAAMKPIQGTTKVSPACHQPIPITLPSRSTTDQSDE